MRSLSEIQTEIDAANAQMQAWSQKHDALTVELMQARTASFDPAIVEKARSVGVNPDNFESEEILTNAVNQVINTNKEIQ